MLLLWTETVSILVPLKLCTTTTTTTTTASRYEYIAAAAAFPADDALGRLDNDNGDASRMMMVPQVSPLLSSYTTATHPTMILLYHSPTQFRDRRCRQSFAFLISVRLSESRLFFYLR